MSEPGDASLQSRARRGLTIYFAVLLPASAFFELMLLRTREPIQRHIGLVFLLMWCPAFASLVARLALAEGFQDVSFRIGGRQGLRALAIAWIYPVAVGFLAYGAAWLSRLAPIAPPPLAALNLAGAPAATRFGALLALNLTLGTAFSLFSAAGEEIGWRGYMLTRLIDAAVPRPVLISGLVWAGWHLPLILSGQYASVQNRWLSALLFAVDIVAFAYLAARLRLESGSVWPAVLLHASWNSVIQGVFDASTRGSSLWVGESGIFTAAVDLVLVALLARGFWRAKRSPEQPYSQPIRALAV